MNMSIVGIIFRKELLDVFRDKRAVIATFVTPILIYPALFIFSSQALMLQQNKINEEASRVAIVEPEPSQLGQWLDDADMIEVVASDDPQKDLNAGDVDALVVAEAPVDAMLVGEASASIRIEYDNTEAPSREASLRIEDVLLEHKESLLTERLKGAAIDPDFINPLRLERVNVAPPEKTSGFLLGAILPMLMVVMLGIGAFYPAVDLTAGEKERGTFETLLSTPARKSEIVTGKFMAVVLIALLTGALNLLSMMLSMGFFLHNMRQADVGLEISISPWAVLSMCVFLIPLALFISSAMMTIAVFARSFREAQNFVTPFFMLILFPAVFAAIPGTELTTTTQFIPITNVSLLFKDILKGVADPQAAFAVFLSTAVYAGLGLIAAAYVFQREDILLAEDKGLPLTLRRSAFQIRTAATPGLAAGLFCTVLLLLFYVGSWAQEQNATIGLIITQWLLILLPVVAVLAFTRIGLRSALSLYVPRPLAWLGAALIAIGWPAVAIEFGYFHNRILPMPEEMGAAFEKIFTAMGETGGLPLLLFAAAFSPAICEEALFRGALLSAWRRVLPLWGVILLTAILFGAFHLSIYRILPTAFSGLILGYVVARGGSLFLGSLIHFANNAAGILLSQASVQDVLRPYFDVTHAEESGLPLGLVAGGVLLTVAGIVCIERAVRVEPPQDRVVG